MTLQTFDINLMNTAVDVAREPTSSFTGDSTPTTPQNTRSAEQDEEISDTRPDFSPVGGPITVAPVTAEKSDTKSDSSPVCAPQAPASAEAAFAFFEDDATHSQIDPALAAVANFGFPRRSSNAPGYGISSTLGSSQSDSGADNQLDQLDSDQDQDIEPVPLMQDLTAFGESVRQSLLPNATAEELDAFKEFCAPHTTDEHLVMMFALLLKTQQLLEGQL